MVSYAFLKEHSGPYEALSLRYSTDLLQSLGPDCGIRFRTLSEVRQH